MLQSLSIDYMQGCFKVDLGQEHSRPDSKECIRRRCPHVNTFLRQWRNKGEVWSRYLSEGLKLKSHQSIGSCMICGPMWAKSHTLKLAVSWSSICGMYSYFVAARSMMNGVLCDSSHIIGSAAFFTSHIEKMQMRLDLHKRSVTSLVVTCKQLLGLLGLL